MSYPTQDEQSEIDVLRDKIENLQSQILDGGASSPLENVDSGQNIVPGANPAARHSPTNDLINDLGDITSPLVINFRLVNNRNLTGNVSGATTITFINIPVLLLLTLRLYIRSIDPVITIGGTIVSGVGSSPLIVTAVDDFLDITLSSTDQSTIVIGTVKKNDETEAPPTTPVFTLSAIGRTLNYAITFPANTRIAQIQYALDSGFTSSLVTKSFARPIGNWDISSVENFVTEELLPNTTYYGRVRFQVIQVFGSYAVTQNVTTGTLLIPSQPTLTVTSPSTGKIRIKVTYPDSPTRNEIAVCTWRLAASVQEYFETIYAEGTTTIANTYSRNSPPSDDLNALENKVEIIRDGAWSPGDQITVRCVLVNASGSSIVSTDNVIVDP